MNEFQAGLGDSFTSSKEDFECEATDIGDKAGFIELMISLGACEINE